MDKISLHHLQDMKTRGEPITMLTAYDYPGGLMADASGVEMILVGDSVGMVVHGFDSTLPVTMDMMVMHCSAVRRGVKRAFLVGDLPFGAYQTDIPTAKKNAVRLLAEGGMDAVKLEGGAYMAETVYALSQMGIAVHGHIGLTPQSVSGMGGYKVQGRTVDTARQLMHDAMAIQEAGAFAIVLEGVPSRLARLISHHLSIPTIGIGAGAGCDGQVLVMHDMVNFNPHKKAKFVKIYADVRATMVEAFTAYVNEVKQHQYPAPEHEYTLTEEVWAELEAEFGDEGDS